MDGSPSDRKPVTLRQGANSATVPFVSIYSADEKGYRTFGNPFPPFSTIQERLKKRDAQLAQKRKPQAQA